MRWFWRRPRTVFLLHEDIPYEGSVVLGIYSSQDKARTALRTVKMVGGHSYRTSVWRIE